MTSADPQAPDAMATKPRDPALAAFHAGPSITCLAVTNRYPSAVASNSVPAPKLAEGISACVNHERLSGEITATRGFSFSETSLADMGAVAGRLGNSVLSS